ncbi:MAG: hypothetical protein KA174_03665 [Chitinophagales bacterium]|nr:hypothetical protein [Saprospirales bacterium]MBP6659750.1 hypothetical protein [Chitinophagales bacterium]
MDNLHTKFTQSTTNNAISKNHELIFIKNGLWNDICNVNHEINLINDFDNFISGESIILTYF